MSRKRSRVGIVTVAAASVLAGLALPSWSAGAAVVDDPKVDAATKATFQQLADAVFADRTQALVGEARSGQQKRTPQRTSDFTGRVRLSGAQSREESSTLDELRTRKSRLARLGEKYSGATTSVTLDATSVKGRRATVAVTETTKLTYEKAKGDAPKATGFQAHHELTFQADRKGAWQLTGVQETDDGYLAVNQVATPPSVPAPADAATAADDMPSAPRAAITQPAPAKPKNLTASGYDYNAMVAYATKYWSKYNPEYPSFDGAGAGGDCTNFVSQALKAGGWKHVPGYTTDVTKWFGNSEIQSYSFIGVNEFSWFALNSQRTTSLANVYQMDIGDVLQLDFDKDGSKDHSMIVTNRSQQGVPYLTYHSTNTYNRSVASLIASYPNAAYYAYRT
ncbi:amidase domain-containing protein [Streptomyces sp. NPDC012623]|uniref:amidase domain-containing protein n=1 Tax=unclassified Streptomyces TaxID=2593676 RepID=UPI0036C12418